MAVETERKFLLQDDSWRAEARKGVRIVQGYFDLAGFSTTIRVRIAGEQGFLTVKGPVVGISRSEYEYEIPVKDAEAMLHEFCGTRIVEKMRYLVEYQGFVWEVDEYFSANAGLFTAEIELDSPDICPPLPPWLGEEVSHDRRYGNGALSRKPFRTW